MAKGWRVVMTVSDWLLNRARAALPSLDDAAVIDLLTLARAAMPDLDDAALLDRAVAELNAEIQAVLHGNPRPRQGNCTRTRR